MKTIYLLFTILILTQGCDKKCATGPIPFELVIKDSLNNDLLSPKYINNKTDSVKLFCLNGNKTDTLEVNINPYTDSDQKTWYHLITLAISTYSANGTKTFYLYRAHGLIDTIYADYYFNKTRCKDIALNEIKFNGKPIDKHTDNTGWYFLAIDNHKK
jgi:hypothetical protein